MEKIAYVLKFKGDREILERLESGEFDIGPRYLVFPHKKQAENFVKKFLTDREKKVAEVIEVTLSYEI